MEKFSIQNFSNELLSFFEREKWWFQKRK
jgi:hypothetical protein